jgi:Tol biopolymer transport system component
VFVANAGRGPIQPVIVNSFSAAFSAVSPDGAWLAYVSNKSGRDEVYIRPWQRDGEEVAVSQGGGSEPVWDPTGRSLYYRRTSARRSDLIEAIVVTRPGFRVSSRSTLFAVTDMTTAANHAGYDVSPNGRTFVMVRRSPPSRIMVLQNLPAIVRDARGEAAARR